MGGSLLRPGMVYAGPDGEAVFETRVPAGSAIGGAWESAVMVPRRQFELIGIGPGEHAGHRAIEVRARSLDGRWSDWLALAHASAWVGPSRALQVRAPRSLRGARLVLVDPGRPAVASSRQRHVDSGLAGQPPIIARSSWATRSCRPRVPAVFGTVELAFVHHTVSSNHYRPSQSASMVRAICLFHKYGNGWNDIGYNFVVDRFGQIFEAREGGIDEAIVGAQAGGYNTFSSGVALLGNFAAQAPTRRTFEALADLLAWKLALHGIELPGTATVRVTRAGAGYSRYPAGAHVRLQRIAGHRDGDTTECPGSAMYRQLPRLRKEVERRLGPVSTLSLERQATAPGSASVGGLLADSAGAPAAGATVEVQTHSTTRPPQTVATATTRPDGTWSADVALATNAQLRAVYRGGDSRRAAVSHSLPLAIPPRISLTTTVPVTIPGGVIDFEGSTQPVKPRATVVVAQHQPDGSLRTIRSIRAATNDDGSFSCSIAFPDAGQYQVIAHTAPDDANATGTSPPLTITVA